MDQHESTHTHTTHTKTSNNSHDTKVAHRHIDRMTKDEWIPRHWGWLCEEMSTNVYDTSWPYKTCSKKFLSHYKIDEP